MTANLTQSGLDLSVLGDFGADIWTLGSVLMTLNPISPVNWAILMAVWCLMSFRVLEKTHGERQYEKAFHWSIPLYAVVAMAVNYTIMRTQLGAK